MHEVVSSIPIVMHIFQILMYWHILQFTSIYWYIQVCTSTYLYIQFFIIWYHATVRDSGYVDVSCPPSLVPINPPSYRHVQTYIYLSGFVHVYSFLRESRCIHLCYCTYTDILVCTVAQVNISRYIAILLESYTPGRNQTSRYMSV